LPEKKHDEKGRRRPGFQRLQHCRRAFPAACRRFVCPGCLATSAPLSAGGICGAVFRLPWNQRLHRSRRGRMAARLAAFGLEGGLRRRACLLLYRACPLRRLLRPCANLSMEIPTRRLNLAACFAESDASLHNCGLCPRTLRPKARRQWRK